MIIMMMIIIIIMVVIIIIIIIIIMIERETQLFYVRRFDYKIFISVFTNLDSQVFIL